MEYAYCSLPLLRVNVLHCGALKHKNGARFGITSYYCRNGCQQKQKTTYHFVSQTVRLVRMHLCPAVSGHLPYMYGQIDKS